MSSFWPICLNITSESAFSINSRANLYNSCQLFSTSLVHYIFFQGTFLICNGTTNLLLLLECWEKLLDAFEWHLFPCWSSVINSKLRSRNNVERIKDTFRTSKDWSGHVCFESQYRIQCLAQNLIEKRFAWISLCPEKVSGNRHQRLLFGLPFTQLLCRCISTVLHCVEF